MQKLTKEERETHISVSEQDGTAIIDTSIQRDITKCRKLGYEVIRENHYEDGSICNVVFKVPRRAISFRSMEAMNKEPSKKQIEHRKRLASMGHNTRF